eukprot:gene22313-28431_t
MSYEFGAYEKEEKKHWSTGGNVFTGEPRLADMTKSYGGPTIPAEIHSFFEKPVKVYGRTRQERPFATAHKYQKPVERPTNYKKQIDKAQLRTYMEPDPWTKPTIPVCGVVKQSSAFQSKTTRFNPATTPSLRSSVSYHSLEEYSYPSHNPSRGVEEYSYVSPSTSPSRNVSRSMSRGQQMSTRQGESGMTPVASLYESNDRNRATLGAPITRQNTNNPSMSLITSSFVDQQSFMLTDFNNGGEGENHGFSPTQTARHNESTDTSLFNGLTATNNNTNSNTNNSSFRLSPDSSQYDGFQGVSIKRNGSSGRGMMMNSSNHNIMENSVAENDNPSGEQGGLNRYGSVPTMSGLFNKSKQQKPHQHTALQITPLAPNVSDPNYHYSLVNTHNNSFSNSYASLSPPGSPPALPRQLSVAALRRGDSSRKLLKSREAKTPGFAFRNGSGGQSIFDTVEYDKSVSYRRLQLLSDGSSVILPVETKASSKNLNDLTAPPIARIDHHNHALHSTVVADPSLSAHNTARADGGGNHTERELLQSAVDKQTPNVNPTIMTITNDLKNNTKNKKIPSHNLGTVKIAPVWAQTQHFAEQDTSLILSAVPIDTPNKKNRNKTKTTNSSVNDANRPLPILVSSPSVPQIDLLDLNSLPNSDYHYQQQQQLHSDDVSEASNTLNTNTYAKQTIGNWKPPMFYSKDSVTNQSAANKLLHTNHLKTIDNGNPHNNSIMTTNTQNTQNNTKIRALSASQRNVEHIIPLLTCIPPVSLLLRNSSSSLMLKGNRYVDSNYFPNNNNNPNSNDLRQDSTYTGTINLSQNSALDDEDVQYVTGKSQSILNMLVYNGKW